MLYRKTTTAFSAVILGVLALLGVSAHAQYINLDAAGSRTDPIRAFTFSKETLLTLTTRETFHAIKVHSGSQNDFGMRATFGYPTPAGTTIGEGPAIRIDLRNLEFNQAVADDLTGGQVVIWDTSGATLLDATAVPRRIVYGATGSPGADSRCPGDTCMIVELGTNASTAIARDDQVILSLWNMGLRVSPDGNGQMLFRHYTNSAAAVNQDEDDGLRKTTGWKTVVNVASSITTRVLAGTSAVADVAAVPRFTNFTPAGTRPLGNITITLNTTHHRSWVSDAEAGVVNSTGLVTSLDDIRPTTAGGGIVLNSSTGSLGFGAFFLATSNECPATGAAGVTVAATGDNAGRGTAALFTGTRHLCVAPRRSSATDRTAPNFEIPVAAITADVGFEVRPNYRFGAPAGAGTVGNIVRNGATVNIGYLTTSTRYNQRIIITNRGEVDAEYELTEFYTEMGTEATAGTAAMGTVPAGQTVVIRSEDAVTFTGTMRRAAVTLTVNAPASVVDVATTQVNLNDGSTDTVNYEVLGTSG